MNLLSLHLENYRNIEHADLIFSPGVNLLFGENAQGKTNALEAVYSFARGKSYRGTSDDQLVKFGEKGFVSAISFHDKVREQTLEYRYYDGSRKRLKNKAPVRLSEMIGSFRAVLFCPEHLDLVKGSPNERRNFLNIAISQIYPVYLGLCSDYNKMLDNRNCLLKNAQKGLCCDKNELDAWSEKLAYAAGEIHEYRLKYIEKLSPYAEKLLFDLSSGRDCLSLAYESEAKGKTKDDLIACYQKLFRDNLTRELAAGCTLFGIHRDDLQITVNGLDSRLFASQGQQRSVVLALKLAEGEVCRDIGGEYPVFLFDDVMSELDAGRRAYVLREYGQRQLILTACESGGFDPSSVNMIRVKNGTFEMPERKFDKMGENLP